MWTLLNKLKTKVPPEHIMLSSNCSFSISGVLCKTHVQDLDGRYSMAVHLPSLLSLHFLAQVFIVISPCIVVRHEESTTCPPLKSNPWGHRASKIAYRDQVIRILIENNILKLQSNIRYKRWKIHTAYRLFSTPFVWRNFDPVYLFDIVFGWITKSFVFWIFVSFQDVSWITWIFGHVNRRALNRPLW